MPEYAISRRTALKNSLAFLGAAAGALSSGSALASRLGRACGLTPPQTEGPFYPVNDQADKDYDLTWVKGSRERAVGNVIYISGQVLDERCAPVPNALVEIWQACASGRYNHPSDTNTAPLDPNFQYWGRATTDAKGEYRFITIEPGAYPADTDWVRPPHIHFKVFAKGYHDLTSQLYFAGNPLNDSDKILGAIARGDRDRVLVELEDASHLEAGARQGRFDITLSNVG